MNKKFKGKGSPLRQLMASSRGASYVSAGDLHTARTRPDMYAIFEGDDGGTIYLTVPVSLIFCTEEALVALLRDIDEIVWNDESMRRIVYEPHTVGNRVAGGMGGGRIESGLWIHDILEQNRTMIESRIGGMLQDSV